MQAVLSLVEAEQGVSIVPGCVRNLRSDGVRFYRLQPDDVRVDLVVAWKKESSHLPQRAPANSSSLRARTRMPVLRDHRFRAWERDWCAERYGVVVNSATTTDGFFVVGLASCQRTFLLPAWAGF